jgi:hypothetical protein
MHLATTNQLYSQVNARDPKSLNKLPIVYVGFVWKVQSATDIGAEGVLESECFACREMLKRKAELNLKGLSMLQSLLLLFGKGNLNQATGFEIDRHSRPRREFPDELRIKLTASQHELRKLASSFHFGLRGKNASTSPG